MLRRGASAIIIGQYEATRSRSIVEPHWVLKAPDVTLWERIRPPSFDGIVCSTHVVGPRVAPVKRQVAIAVSLGRSGALQLCLYVLSCNNQRAADDHGNLPEGESAPSLLAVHDDLLHASTDGALTLIERPIRQ